ncbi:MAG: aldehyde dehydrogenase family protein, partial [Gemmatimonadota bacterium]
MSEVSPVIIAGRRAAARSRVTRLIQNPATLEEVGIVADCGPEDVHAAVEAAAQAQPEWWRIP